MRYQKGGYYEQQLNNRKRQRITEYHENYAKLCRFLFYSKIFQLLNLSYMDIIFFDTETNGVPKNYKAPVEDLDNWPRIAELGYQVYTPDGKLIHEHVSLIKPNGWVIPSEQFFIENGMTTERCELEGNDLESELLEFWDYAAYCHAIVAHNLAFDSKVTAAEFLRLGFEEQADILIPNHSPLKICTMESTVDFCKIPGKYGYKWPKLIELHQMLFGCDFDGAHAALSDVAATAKCFFELVRLGVIKL